MFGKIDGINIGDIFNSRQELREAGIHAPTMAGIWGAQEGAYSIVLSGGYEDDIDELDYILYTGQGGQDVPGGIQVADQEFTKGNRGLQLSCQYQLPVRVSRGFQIKNGPTSGYRYDGLYYVSKYERIKGKRGFYICRFHLHSETSFNELENKLSSNFKNNYVSPSRSSSTVNRLNRNVALSEKVKKTYDFKCQVCNVKLNSPSGPIAIGAHIKPLGMPHNGPDVIQNMLCLCPNHHDQLDYYSFYIDPENLEIIGLNELKNKKLTINPKHKIEKDFLTYRKEQYFKNNKTTEI